MPVWRPLLSIFEEKIAFKSLFFDTERYYNEVVTGRRAETKRAEPVTAPPAQGLIVFCQIVG